MYGYCSIGDSLESGLSCVDGKTAHCTIDSGSQLSRFLLIADSTLLCHAQYRVTGTLVASALTRFRLSEPGKRATALTMTRTVCSMPLGCSHG